MIAGANELKYPNMKKRVMCVFGTRPEAVKLAPVVHALKRSPNYEPVVAITAQHREMLDQMMRWFDVKADYDLDLMQHGQTLAELNSRVLLGMDKLLSQDKPDLLLVQGDTTTVMAASQAAFYHKVPVGHIEAGLRTNDRYNPFPEEMARRVTGRLASLHFAPTPLAVQNLAREGIVDNVYMTGNTVIDALLDTAGRLKEDAIDKSLFGAADFDRFKVLLVTAHRRENWGRSMGEIAHALRQIADDYPDIQVLYPIHKNPVVRESIEPVFAGHDRLILAEPLDYVPFVHAMRKCHFILTDSGGVQEEAPALGKPVLVMRTNTERPEAVTAGAARLVGVERDTIYAGARDLMNDPEQYKKMACAVNPFGDGHASDKIVAAIDEYFAGESSS